MAASLKTIRGKFPKLDDYVNTGDLYNATVVYDVARETFEITTVGDWREQNES